ncbi:MAG: TetR-like C-terminal domain-containing protein [Pseudomonadota bacterium]
MAKQASSRESYHHGDLPSVLIREGARLLDEKGADGFSMREVARRAGVAVAAPAHHFGNAKGLLTAIAAEGFSGLAEQLAAAPTRSEDIEDRVAAMCAAYVAFGKREPGRLAVMFRLELIDEGDEHFLKESSRAFGCFEEALRRAAAAPVNDTEVNRAAKTLWAAMHGLLALRMIPEQEADELISFAVSSVLGGLQR